MEPLLTPFEAFLWIQCQAVTYPKRFPSLHPPFDPEGLSPKRRPASWLYHKLVNDPELRKQVFP